MFWISRFPEISDTIPVNNAPLPRKYSADTLPVAVTLPRTSAVISEGNTYCSMPVNRAPLPRRYSADTFPVALTFVALTAVTFAYTPNTLPAMSVGRGDAPTPVIIEVLLRANAFPLDWIITAPLTVTFPLTSFVNKVAFRNVGGSWDIGVCDTISYIFYINHVYFRLTQENISTSYGI